MKLDALELVIGRHDVDASLNLGYLLQICGIPQDLPRLSNDL